MRDRIAPVAYVRTRVVDECLRRSVVVTVSPFLVLRDGPSDSRGVGHELGPSGFTYIDLDACREYGRGRSD